MAGEIQLNSTTALTEDTGAITLNNVNSSTNRTNLGLGSVATQASDSVSLTGGTITNIKLFEVTVYTSGSGTYTVPTGSHTLEIEMAGAGGGGSGSGGGNGAVDGGAGGTGGSTSFGSATVNGGSGGADTPGFGGSASSTSGITIVLASTGANGSANGSYNVASNSYSRGGRGNATPLGGYGKGGDGAVNGANSVVVGNGGGAGAYLKGWITSPSATYSYAVGAAGSAGTAGTNGNAGSAGGSGAIIIKAYL